MDILNSIGWFQIPVDLVQIIFQWANKITDLIIEFYLSNASTFCTILLAIIYLYHYITKVVKKPVLVCAQGKFRWFLLANCSCMSEYYWPTIWCYEAHLLTAFANLFRGFSFDLHYHRELVLTPDGGQISLDWYEPKCKLSNCQPTSNSECNNRPIALFIAGLTGTSQSEYIKTLVPIAYQIGYRAVVINYRGLGNTPLLTPRLYCAANDDDIRTAIDHIRQRNSNIKLVAIGVSLGGILLCRYMIKSGFQSKINATFLISVCWDLMSGWKNMEKSLNYPLNQHLTRLLIKVVNQNYSVLKDVPEIDLDQVQKCQNIREFDEAFTIKMFNFKSVCHYYEESSHIGKVICIKTPTLCINAADDMFAPSEALPWDIEETTHVAMLVTSRGGHIGFMEGFFPWFKPKYYSERLAEQYLQALFQLTDFREIV